MHTIIKSSLKIVSLVLITSFISFSTVKADTTSSEVSTKTNTATESKAEVNKDASKDEAKKDSKKTKEKPSKKGKKMTGTKAIIKTSLGTITIKLFQDKAPKTVANFVGLATGSKEWTDPKSGQKMKEKPLYDGTIFHRVIPDFMIQAGDPLGKGIGGPGYKFEDEFSPKDNFDKPGILAMANSGPGTNGSQFFITVKATPWLNGHHTIFGEVTDGLDVVMKISKADRDGMDRPKTEIKIEHITIE